MTLEDFLYDDYLNDELGEYLDRFCKVDEVSDYFARMGGRDADVSNEACETLGKIQAAIIKLIVKRWEALNERECR